MIVAEAARVVALEALVRAGPIQERVSFASLAVGLASRGGGEALVADRPATAIDVSSRATGDAWAGVARDLGTNGQALPDDLRGETDPSPAGLAAVEACDLQQRGPPFAIASTMTLPRVLKPGTTYLVTRRCLERRFRLRPEQAVNDLLDYLVGYAALQSGVEVVAMVAMSSHLHLVIHDPDTGLADFMERLCSLAARALNVLHSQVGQVWEAGSYSAVPLETPGEIVEKIAYTLANPTKAGLTATPEEWPGLITLVDSLGRGMRPVKRPGYFFREDGEERRQGERDQRPSGWSDTPLPGAVVWELALPPGFDDADELQRQVRVALEEKLARIHADRRRAGKRAFLGAKTVLAQSIMSTPASTEELFRLNPRLAFRDWTRRAQACSGWLSFQFGYRAALGEYRDGNHEAEFPFGTYAMRVRFGVRCSSGAGA